MYSKHVRKPEEKKCIECRRRRAGCDVGVVKCSQIVSSNSSCLDVDGVNVSEQLVEDTGTVPFEAKESLLSVTTDYARCGKIMKKI